MLLKLSLHSVLCLTVVFGAGATSQAKEVYEIDQVHSSVIFAVSHQGVGKSFGRFNELSGRIVTSAPFDKHGIITMVVKTASVDTANAKRDKHLSGPDFFNSKRFPDMRFTGHTPGDARGGDGVVKLSGDFTLLGVTKPLVVEAKLFGTGEDKKGNKKVGYEVRFTIKRSDFGMDYMLGAIGDEVEVIVAVEAVQVDSSK